MFTVLIAEKKHIDAIQQGNKLFFEPFLENKEIAFCCWNPEGQNLYDSVPGLMEAVGRNRDWRAVIINRSSEELRTKRNPFDVVDSSKMALLHEPKQQPEQDEDWDAWENDWKAYFEALSKEKECVYKNALEHPLQKLSTWLCFRPEDYILNDVQEKQDVYDWAMDNVDENGIKPSVRLELLEREQYKREIRLKEILRREFVGQKYLNIAYPSEIHCISIRTTEHDFFDPDSYWNVRRENEYSSFADRNMYFDKMRFLVCDLLPHEHQNFRTDYIRFLASVLIFISNPVPSSAMQARKLYCLETETDDTPLCKLVMSYDKKLARTIESIENEMEKIRSEIPGEMTDKDAQDMFCTSKELPILMDTSCDFDKVFVNEDYGLFFDSPENELHKWNRDSRASKESLIYITKQQTKALRKSIGQLNQAAEIADVNVSRLTTFQIDDIKEYADNAEDDMVVSIPRDLSDLSEFTERISEKSDSVKKMIDQRMTKKTTITLAAFCLFLYLICFLPSVFANIDVSEGLEKIAILCVMSLGLLALVMFITLFVLRDQIKKAIKDYNETVDSITDEVQTTIKDHVKYLTDFTTVRKGHAISNYAKKNLDEYTRELRIRKKHKEDIRKCRAYLAEGYGDYFADVALHDETISLPYEYDFSQQTEYTYPAPFLPADFRHIEFISSGNFVPVPFSYVTRLLVRLEGIYE